MLPFSLQSSVFPCPIQNLDIKMYGIIIEPVLVWNLILHSCAYVWEQGAEDSIWT
jgi:hypothetical protein